MNRKKKPCVLPWPVIADTVFCLLSRRKSRLMREKPDFATLYAGVMAFAEYHDTARPGAPRSGGAG